MDVVDVSALFGNMLDNAIESAEKQKEEKLTSGRALYFQGKTVSSYPYRKLLC